MKLDCIVDAACIGYNDDIRGQVPVGFVIVAKGQH